MDSETQSVPPSQIASLLKDAEVIHLRAEMIHLQVTVGLLQEDVIRLQEEVDRLKRAASAASTS